MIRQLPVCFCLLLLALAFPIPASAQPVASTHEGIAVQVPEGYRWREGY